MFAKPILFEWYEGTILTKPRRLNELDLYVHDIVINLSKGSPQYGQHGTVIAMDCERRGCKTLVVQYQSGFVKEYTITFISNQFYKLDITGMADLELDLIDNTPKLPRYFYNLPKWEAEQLIAAT